MLLLQLLVLLKDLPQTLRVGDLLDRAAVAADRAVRRVVRAVLLEDLAAPDHGEVGVLLVRVALGYGRELWRR